MTLEELLQCSADQLEKMTDAELELHFAPYLKVTRPELADKPQERTKKRIDNPVYSSKIAKANALLKQLGIDLKI